ncbi:MAG: TolC family protein [Gemmatimonadetes bacterium]|nr:TolC family protein [Gemmatimonadota bacterium]
MPHSKDTTRRVLGLGALLLVLVVTPSWASAQVATGVAMTPWWDELGDETLTGLLRGAMEANGDLEAAVARMLQAEASADRSRAALMPSLSLDAQGSTGPLDGLGFQFGGIPRGGGGNTPAPSLFYTGSATARASYRLSSWGSEYRTLKATRLEAMARRGDEDGVALGLVGQVAQTYYDVVSATAQIAVITRQLEVGGQLAEVAQLRYERGEATALEVLQQRQQLATTRATLPAAQIDLRLAQSRLESLLGRDPSGETVAVDVELPGVGEATGQPGTIDPLARPELRGAADRFQAAEARVSAAKWSVLPTVSLSASTGSQFFRSLGTTTQSTWGASMTVSLPVWDGFDRSAHVREASMDARANRSSMEQLRLNALAEVVSARVQQEGQQAQLAALRDQLDASERAFEESRRRYLAGLATVLDVLNAMNGMQQAELGVIRTQRTVLASWIQLKQAIGGPWTQGLRRRLLESS